MDSIVLIVIVVALVVILVIAGLVLAQRARSEKLRRHFGTEYERTVGETGDRRAAEADLAERERRHRELDLRALRPEERDDFTREWDSVQSTFVDDPPAALRHADMLVVQIMRTRGYPVDDFDRRAADISVAHPDVVHHYREARSVHDASSGGPVDTERQRHALTSYRSLVQALLGEGNDRRAEQDRAEQDRGYASHPDGASVPRTDAPAETNRDHRSTEEQTP